MGLSSIQLEAFAKVAECQSFSRAAKELYITQSALSQRVLNLEDELGVTLFIRDTKALRLTEVGDRLLRYCLAKDSLESEFTSSLEAENELAGVVKIGSFSTYTRSRLIPKLNSFLRAHEKIQIEILSKEVWELPELLYTGRVQYIFTTEPLKKSDLVVEKIGEEENVLIESSKYKTRQNTFIDHDEFDQTTADFLKIQNKSLKNYSRIYFDEIYSIIEAVEQGLGKAVVPLHLVAHNKKVRRVPRTKSLKTPIFLTYYQQAYYSQLQKELLKILGT